MAILDGSTEILCVPQQAARRALGTARGFVSHPAPEHRAGPIGSRQILAGLLREAEWLPRTAALEADPAWRQLIPYGVLCRGGRIFAYRRHRSGGEARLHDLCSLGVGGHVERTDELPTDGGDPDELTLARCLAREVSEEVGAEIASARLLGLLWDDSTPVNSVHLGIVYRVEVEIREGSAIAGDLVPIDWFEPEAIRSAALAWETWSRILIDQWLPRAALQAD